MNKILNYSITEKLFESKNSLVYRAQEIDDGTLVVLKVLKEDHTNKSEFVRYRQEYQLTSELDVQGVIKTYGLKPFKNTLAIILEDFNGESLSLLSKRKKIFDEELLDIFINVTKTLGEIHKNNVIHKDINPSNLVYNSDTREVKVIDFGISTALPRESPTFMNLNGLEGTLAYMSPEQTGRTNRTLDYRTDYYALGVSFYQLFGGRLPFDIEDPLELVHCHLAREPLPLSQLNADLPDALCAIIHKLMAKTAEERYQSAQGLLRDLQHCRSAMQQGLSLNDFEIAEHDVSDKFQLPQTLYGRDDEVASFLTAFERVAEGASELMLVTGYSGIGKTSLVACCYKPITQKRGYFSSGKFDQYQKNVPYSAVVEALRELIQQLLAETESQLDYWRTRLIEALGDNGQLIVDVLPNLELIIGKQAVAESLGPNEAQNRFSQVFRNFIGVFCTPEHPLVLFIDDLQWVDSASLKLFELMLSGAHSLFLIGAYRSNEVGPGHPLLHMLEDIRKTKTNITSIELGPLSHFQIEQFIADTVHCEPDEVTDLADLVEQKTQGNPFFIGEFLKSLYAEDLLTFHHDKGRWYWNLQDIIAKDITDNVVELMAAKVRPLEEKVLRVLQLAACIGNSFDLQTLSIVYEQTHQDTIKALWIPLAEGLIVPMSDAYKAILLGDIGQSAATNVRWKFAHDRVQQAVYSLIGRQESSQMHWQIGQLLLSSASEQQLDAQIFIIVDQLNFRSAEEKDPGERLRLAELNLMAGKKAKESAAYGPAFEYLEKSISLLANDCWIKNYDLSLKIYHEIAETQYLRGNFDDMNRHAETVFKNAVTLLDKMHMYQLQVQAHMSNNHQLDAVETALKVLALMDVKFPESPSQLRIFAGLGRAKLALAGKSFDSLLLLPKMTDPKQLAIMKMLSSIWAAAYQARPNLMPLIVFRMVILSLRHGNCDQSVLAYAWYGLLLCGVTGEIESGYGFGQLALKLLERFQIKELKARLGFVVYCFIAHWKNPAQTTLQPSVEAFQSGLETGSFEFAAYAAIVYCYHGYFLGKPLADVESDLIKYGHSLRDIKQLVSLNYILIFQQTCVNLTKPTNDPKRLQGDIIDARNLLASYAKSNDRTGIQFVYVNQMILGFLFGDLEFALENADLWNEHLDGATSLLVLTPGKLYESLTCMALYEKAGHKEQRRLKTRIQRNIKQIERWANFQAFDKLPSLRILQAEWARITDQPDLARSCYDEAISLARQAENWHLEALACELASKFFRSGQNLRLADHYLKDAYFAFRNWGAEAKLELMEKTYPGVFSTLTPGSTKHTNATIRGTLRSTATNQTTVNVEIDLKSVLKSCQAIAEERVFDDLIRKLLHIVLQNAGAVKGWLMIHHEQGWALEARAEVDQFSWVRLKLDQLDKQNPELPLEMIHYVIRTQEPVVLSNATSQGQFVQTRYIKTKRPLSVMCFPIKHKGGLVGLIYLENSLTTGAFTPDRLNLLELISSQIAISIENALYYTKQEQVQQAEQARVAAEAASEAKTEFLAHMSHELRTPLNGILGYAQILERDRTLSTEQARGVKIIRDSGKHLLMLINDVLDLAKIEAGSLQLRLEDIHLGVFLRHIVDLFELKVREKRLVFSYQNRTSLPEGVRTDEKRLAQVLMNLIGNAIKFTDEGGITLSVEWLEGRLHVAVIDTGVGISDADLKEVFKPFQQVGADKYKAQGTGLGLPITKRLVEAMGGALEVKSSPGNGTSVSFSIALQPVEGIEAPGMAQSDNIIGIKSGPRRILVVDDSWQNRSVIRQLLEPLGFEVIEAADGAEGLVIAKREIPDAMILDLLMPVMDGYACARQVRSTDAIRDMVIIAVSASVMGDEQQKALDSGANLFLAKPIEATQIFAALADKLGICWLFSEEVGKSAESVAKRREIIRPQVEHIVKLRELNDLGDIMGVLIYVKSIEGAQEEFCGFTDEVVRLASGFQELQLKTFLKQSKDSSVLEE